MTHLDLNRKKRAHGKQRQSRNLLYLTADIDSGWSQLNRIILSVISPSLFHCCLTTVSHTMSDINSLLLHLIWLESWMTDLIVILRCAGLLLWESVHWTLDAIQGNYLTASVAIKVRPSGITAGSISSRSKTRKPKQPKQWTRSRWSWVVVAMHARMRRHAWCAAPLADGGLPLGRIFGGEVRAQGRPDLAGWGASHDTCISPATHESSVPGNQRVDADRRRRRRRRRCFGRTVERWTHSKLRNDAWAINWAGRRSGNTAVSLARWRGGLYFCLALGLCFISAIRGRRASINHK